MDKESVFTDTLQALMELAQAQGHVLTGEQIKDALADLELDEKQIGMVHGYLHSKQIGVDGPAEAVPENFSETDGKHLKIYLEDLEGLPGGGLLEKMLPQVVDIAKLYAGRGVLPEDLIGEGNLALADALDRGGEEFSESGLGRVVMDAMEACVAKNQRVRRGDEKALQLMEGIQAAARELSEDLGRKVNAAEIAGGGRYSVEEIQKALSWTNGLAGYIEP